MIFLSFRKLTTLLCLVCSLLFHSGVAEWSFLGVTGVVYSRKVGNMLRLALCLVRIELKLRRFRQPTFMVLKCGACCKYVTSIHEYLISFYWLELSLEVTPQT